MCSAGDTALESNGLCVSSPNSHGTRPGRLGNVGITGSPVFREWQQPQPDEIIRIRYDSLDNLVALGIVAKARPVIPVTNPFPASPQQHYVPDPPAAGPRGPL